MNTNRFNRFGILPFIALLANFLTPSAPKVATDRSRPRTSGGSKHRPAPGVVVPMAYSVGNRVYNAETGQTLKIAKSMPAARLWADNYNARPKGAAISSVPVA